MSAQATDELVSVRQGIHGKFTVQDLINITNANWAYFEANVKYTNNDTIITTGEVLECVYQGGTFYRYIATDMDAYGYPTEDAFYTDFDGTILTNKLAERHN